MSEPSEVDGSPDLEAPESGAARTPVAVESVAVERAPGFERTGFTVEGFSPGVNVVYGANAAGKTTLSRAIRWSLWPDRAPASATVHTEFAYDGDRRAVRLRGGAAEHLRDGAAADPIPVPSLGAGRRYALSLRDMLQEETDDGEFAAVIQRESTGGFDVDAVRAAVGLEGGASPATRNLAATREAADAVEQLRERRRRAPDLDAEKRELADVRERFEAAATARQRVDLLETAASFSAARAASEAASAELESFPEELAAFDGDELGRLEELEERIRKRKAAEQEAATTHREAARTLAATALPDGGVPDGDLATLREHHQRLADVESERNRLKRELDAAEAKREAIREDIPLGLDGDALRDLETEDLAELRSFVETATAVQGSKRAEAVLREWLPGKSAEGPARAALERGRDALENWLAAPPDGEGDGEPGRRRAVRVAVAAGTLAAVAGGVIGTAIDPLGYLVSVLGLGLSAYAVLAGRGDDDATNSRATHAETFRQTGLDAPAAWEAEAVRDRLAEVRRRLADLELDERAAAKRRELLARHDPGELEAELETARDRLRERLDVDVHRDVDLAVTVERVERWQAAHEAVCGKRRELSTATEQIEDGRDEFVAALAPYVPEGDGHGIETAADAAGAIENLDARQRDYERARERLDAVRGDVAQAREELDRLRAKREALFTDRGLEPGDRDRLAALCDRLPEYEAAVEARDEAKRAFETERADLRDHPLYEAEIEDRSEADLRAELEDARETAAEYDDLLEAKTELERDVEAAKRATDVADAVQRRDGALADLEAELAADVADAVADELLDVVEEATVTGNQEPVFRRADELLRLITGGQFELRLEDGTFRAYDTGEGRRVDLNDCSSGTRVQVLLAVRVAFVEHRERATAPPLLLDETLAPFDDRRAATVLDAVIELARQGRQVFYFTARRDERERWKRRLEAADVAYGLTGLTAAEDDPVAEPPTLDAAGAVDVPAPAGDDHETYRRTLEVPTFDPRQGAAAAPLWYVTEDPDALYRLRTAGVERWGHLRSLLAVGAVDGLLEEGARERVRRHGEALEAFVDAYTVGRGKPVDREVLAESDAVSDRFIDEASALAARVDGDPEAVLAGLSEDVDYFREEKVEELRATLRAEGYLDPTPTRPDEQIRAAVVDGYCRNGLSPAAAAGAAARLLERISAGPDAERPPD